MYQRSLRAFFQVPLQYHGLNALNLTGGRWKINAQFQKIFIPPPLLWKVNGNSNVKRGGEGANQYNYAWGEYG